ncbi:MAG: D-aminoacyl-tRNA deacylase, partial [Candidatus Omnitrophica bacterium]|nr:D-aminoacyl-tRNA deacylase [Candidatus Omnitrophota bacterium]
MRVVVQRVKTASLTVNGSRVGSIGHGLVILVGFGHQDDETDGEELAG